MILVITERWVLRKIAQHRYRVARKDSKVNRKEAESILTYRKVRGVERDAFNDYLINELDPIPSRLRHKLYPILKYFYRFDAAKGGKLIISVNDIIDQALKDGYLYPLDYCEDEDFDRLKLTKKGYKYISRLYWICSFYNNHHAQDGISTLIKWGIPLLVFWILSHFFNINITPK
ncbi:MAG: hypothetical protein UV94_C0029G0007 [Parcubacteria group bacterium GW2011_GWC1_43_30]|nr:MAG: hypothetical protein UV94_C0029G0007 [Parcubacteria group bacterium GW2011_GWC1_43_30]